MQLAALVSVTIAATATLLFLTALGATNRMIAIQEEGADSALVDSVRTVMEGRLDQAELALGMLATDPEFQTLLAERDRSGMSTYLEFPWRHLQRVATRLHVHLPGSVSFLRMHDPDRYGDDLSSLRPMVNAVDDSAGPVLGIEVGVHGMSQRVVLPVWRDDSYLGSIEVGLPFDQRELREFGERHAGDYFLYRFADAGANLVSATSTDDVCPMSDAALGKLRRGEVYSSTSCSLRDHVLGIPLVDYSGAVIAYLKVVTDRTVLEAGLRAMRFRLSMLAIAATLLIPAVVWIALGRLLRPLSMIVAQTHAIANRIASGNHEYQGDVSASSPDFREIIVEINRIIAALRSSEVQKQAILDGFPGMIYLVDADLTVVWANESALARRPEMVGKNCRRDFHGDSLLECEHCILVDALQSARIERGSSWFTRDEQHDQQCWEYAAVPVAGVGDRVGHIVMIAWEITDKMTTQRALEDLNQTLEQRVRDEIRAREVQEQMLFQQAKLAAIGELAAGIAHEVNQPLNTLSFAFENLARRVADSCVEGSELDAKRQTIAESLRRIRYTLDHVRTFSREQLREFREPFDVNDALRGAFSMLGAQFEAHGIEMNVRYAPTPARSFGNVYELEQVVLNLCSNSRYAVEHRRRAEGKPAMVTLAAEAHDEWVVVTVTDTGDGIPPEIRDRVLEPFFTTKGPQDGTGLGLSISFGIVDRMGGRIEIDSTERDGATVRVFLPRYSRDDPATGEDR